MNQQNIKHFNRNSPISIDLSCGDSHNDQRVHFMIPINGRLFAFSDNSIKEILLAETIDPENKHPETRHAFQKIFNIGTRNSFVARSIIQAHDLLNSLILRPECSKEAILSHVWECSKLLFKCEQAFYSVFVQCEKLIKECDEIVSKHKNSHFIPQLPQVENLEAHVVSFLGHAKRFLEGAHQLFSHFFQTPDFEANFQNYVDWFRVSKPECGDLITLLCEDGCWIRELAWRRNALDANHSRDNFKVEIFNFRIQPGNKFSAPAWKYDFTGKSNGKRQEEPVDLLSDMNVVLYNLLTFFEEIFILSLKEIWDNRVGFQIFKREAKDISEECPTLYFASLKEFPPANLIPKNVPEEK